MSPRHNVILIFVNSVPIVWYSKRRATNKSYTCGSKVVALRKDIETIKILLYKIEIMGLLLSGPAYIFGDNKCVVNGALIHD